MRRVALFLALAGFAGCAGGTPPTSPSIPPSNAIPVGVRDLGRRPAGKTTPVVILLRYNHEAELLRFIDQLEKEPRPHYLTRQAFLARYAPTPLQERRVIDAVRAAGFRVTHRYKNRLLIDAEAPSMVVERLFQTQINDFDQGRDGVRSANVRPLHIPTQLSADVTAVEANDVVLARTFAPHEATPQDSGTNAVQNGNFASGKLRPWTSCGPASAAISREHPKTGEFDAITGSATTKQEVKGWSAICQGVIVPPNATLSAWFYGQTNEPNEKHSYQEAAIADASNKPTIVLQRTNFRQDRWVHKTWDLSFLAGKKETLLFGVYGSGRKNYYDQQYVDDVTLTGKPSPTPAPGLGPNGGWGPSDVTNGLQFPSTKGYTGANQTVANVIDATILPSDLATYLNYFNIDFTGTVTNEAVDGGTTYTGEGEANLDVETMAGLAPAANIIVYDVPVLTNAKIEDAYNQAASDGKAAVINSSFGECENVDPTFVKIDDGIALGAAAQGITYSASGGDNGPECWDEGKYVVGINAPASAPHFVSVGGTQSGTCYASSGSIANPSVWNDCIGAGGGGVSAIWTQPPYQQGVAGAQPSGRNVPDIALPAAHDSLYIGPNWYMVWGTSWASPIYVAMQAEIDQSCGAPQWGIATLYSAFAKTGYRYDFDDVIHGSNSVNGVAGSSALPGFDDVSGIGIPLGAQIAIDDCGSR